MSSALAFHSPTTLSKFLALRTAGLQLSSDVISLSLPLTNNLVKVPGTLLGDDSSSMGALILHGHLLQLSFKTVLGLFSGGHLCVQGVNGLLSLSNTARKLGLASLKLINSAKT